MGEAIRELFRTIRALRAGLLVALFGAVIVFLPPQVREIYGILAEDARERGLQIVFLYVLLALFVLVQRQTAATALWDWSGAPSRIVRGVTAFVTGVLPLAMAGGMLMAASDIQIEGVKSETLQRIPELNVYRAAISTSTVVLYFGAALCVLVAVVGIMASVRSGACARVLLLYWDLAGRRTRLAFALAVAATVALYTVIPLQTANAVGTLGIVLWFLVCLAVVCGAATRLSDRSGVPVVLVALAVGVLISSFNWNDNHGVQPDSRPAVRLPSVEKAFREWYAERKDKSALKGPYPVFLVSAAGGGLYAAQHAAKVLSRLQDRCPAFAQHTFLISGVSGGSVGAAVFGSLAKNKASRTESAGCNPAPTGKGEFETAAEAVLNHDFLGSLVGATLFPDFLQRFVPLRFNVFDRGRTLDQALEHAWLGTVPGSGALSAPYLDYWSAAGAAPALVLNATSVERGHRVVATPFRIAALGSALTGLTGLMELHHLLLDLPSGADPALEVADITRDIKLSTAAGLTARFPWISPAASISLPSRTARLVDGGYYENSGMETIIDVLNNLKKFETRVEDTSDPNRPFVKFFLIAINSLDDFERDGWAGMGELLSPIRTMLAARSQRGYLALYRALTERSPGCMFPDLDATCDPSRWKLFFLNHSDFNLPLGWHLSSATRSVIDLHSGYPERDSGRSMAFESRNKDERLRGFIELNNDAACQVTRVFDGRSGELCSAKK